MSADRKAMSGAELKVQLTGLGLTPVWLADRLHVTSRTVIRWFDLDEVPDKAVAEIAEVSALTIQEMRRIAGEAMVDGVVRTRRKDGEGVAQRNTLPATWHRHLTFRVLENLRSKDVSVTVGYAEDG